MLQSLAADRGYDLQFRVLQYGVTRAALSRLLAKGPGWDVLHFFSGHGLASQLILECEDGTPDPVTSAERVELLRPARGRLRWVTMSSCLSAAATVDETLRWLGLGPERQRDLGTTAELAGEAEDEPGGEPAALRMPALAWTLARELDCAVLAMRFPVGDEFAIDLGQAVSAHPPATMLDDGTHERCNCMAQNVRDLTAEERAGGWMTGQAPHRRRACRRKDAWPGASPPKSVSAEG